MAKIKVDEKVYWDDSLSVEEQSQKAKEWLSETRIKPADKVVRDNYQRPYLFTWNTKYAVLQVERKFVYPESTDWSIDKNIISVTAK